MADQQPPETPSATPSGEPPAATDAPGAPVAAGEFEIGDTVIAKIAHMACREVEGVHALGGATSRALSSLHVADTRTQGVTVDLRGDSVDVDLTLVVTYGRSIPEGSPRPAASACATASKRPPAWPSRRSTSWSATSTSPKALLAAKTDRPSRSPRALALDALEATLGFVALLVVGVVLLSAAIESCWRPPWAAT